MSLTALKRQLEYSSLLHGKDERLLPTTRTVGALAGPPETRGTRRAQLVSKGLVRPDATVDTVTGAALDDAFGYIL